ncbi:MAG: hypothetical protein HC846_06360 [Blastocatellia bacterium]|nr:hypothetical protein [Blastocatellia bacterium]
MTGWEATADLGGHHSIAFKHFREKILNDAINDLGINRIRLEIRSGIENPTDYYAKWQAGEITEKEFEQKRYENINDDSNPKQINPEGFKWTQFDDVVENVVLPLRKISQARGDVLQVNVNYVDFDPSTSLHRNNPEEYAELVLATYQHLQSEYGFVPDSWEVILEPDNGSWSAEQVAAAIKSAGEVLIANNFKPNFIAPSTMNAEVTLAYIDKIAETPKIMEYISEFSYHRYSGVSDEVLQAIGERAKKYGKKTAMLELIGADYNVLHQDLKLANNSSWQQYTLVYHNQPDNGAQYFLLNDKNPQNPTFEIASRTKFYVNILEMCVLERSESGRKLQINILIHWLLSILTADTF